jgi:hypothetical protein
MGSSLWWEDGSVVYNCPLQSSHFRVRAPWDLWSYFTVSDETSLFVASYDSQGYGGGIRPRLYTEYVYLSKSKSKLCYDRRPVGQSLLVSSTQLGLMTIFLFVRQLRVCWCGALSLTREQVCRSQLLPVLASAVILGSESHGTRDHILLSLIRDFSQPGGPGPSIYIPQEQGGPVTPQALGSLFVASYDSRGYGGGIRTRLHAGYLMFNCNGSYSLCDLGTDRTENTVKNSSSVVSAAVTAVTSCNVTFAGLFCSTAISAGPTNIAFSRHATS